MSAPAAIGMNGAKQAGTSVVRAVTIQYAKGAVSAGAGYLGHEAGEALGLPEWANVLIGTGVGIGTGFGVEALDRSYSFSGYHISKSVPPSRNITKDDLSDDVLKNKPKNSPDPEKWLSKNGRISIDEDGIWTYTNADGQSVKYPGGYPDFKEAGLVKQEVNIG